MISDVVIGEIRAMEKRVKKTIARKYLGALEKGERVGSFLRSASWLEESRVIVFEDGSVVWLHVGTGTMREAPDVGTARRKVIESVGDARGERT